MSNIKKPSRAVNPAVFRQWDETEAFLAECYRLQDAEQRTSYLATKPDQIWLCNVARTPQWHLGYQGYADIEQLLKHPMRFIDWGELSQYGTARALKRLQPSALLGIEYDLPVGAPLKEMAGSVKCVHTRYYDLDLGIGAELASVLRGRAGLLWTGSSAGPEKCSLHLALPLREPITLEEAYQLDDQFRQFDGVSGGPFNLVFWPYYHSGTGRVGSYGLAGEPSLAAELRAALPHRVLTKFAKARPVPLAEDDRTEYSQLVHRLYPDFCVQLKIEFNGWGQMATCFMRTHEDQHPSMSHLAANIPNGVPLAFCHGHYARGTRPATRPQVHTIAEQILDFYRQRHYMATGHENRALKLGRKDVTLKMLLFGLFAYEKEPSSFPDRMLNFETWLRLAKVEPALSTRGGIRTEQLAFKGKQADLTAVEECYRVIRSIARVSYLMGNEQFALSISLLSLLTHLTPKVTRTTFQFLLAAEVVVLSRATPRPPLYRVGWLPAM